VLALFRLSCIVTAIEALAAAETCGATGAISIRKIRAETAMPLGKNAALQRFEVNAAWEARTLRNDKSWIIRLTDSHRTELITALENFKESARLHGMTAQWLHGNMAPRPENFPLPTLGPLLGQARIDLESRYGLILFKGFPVAELPLKDLHLLHMGLASHVGALRPQTVFGELVQDVKDGGQAPLRERRGSKHNRALPFHNDPSDAISFLCVKAAQTGGLSLFSSSVAIHNAMLDSAPEHVEALYQDVAHSYQDYLFVRTGANQRLLPRTRFYSMPTFTAEQGYFACKYSRFYIEQAQEFPDAPRLSERQQAGLNAFEEELRSEKWQFSLQYEPGDVVFINNFVCFHARTAFIDESAEHRRHLQRVWLSMPNSRPLSPEWKRQVFFKRTEAGAVRGGVPVPEISYA
jgi:alpha-ketoglutarate-dependent taurine dioxygenase